MAFQYPLRWPAMCGNYIYSTERLLVPLFPSPPSLLFARDYNLRDKLPQVLLYLSKYFTTGYLFRAS